MLKERKHFVKRNLFTVFLTIIFIFSSLPVYAEVSQQRLNSAVEKTAQYIYKTVKNPELGSIGGEWAILGLARSGYAVPQSYYDMYYKNVENYVKKSSGILHRKKYTEYSRVTLGLTSIGKDPKNVGGYNLLEPLGDYENTVWQGINGAIFALIALDTANYPIPVNKEAKTQATRDLYINHILSLQLSDGGWAMSGEKSDPDITGMALQALAKYQQRPAVKTATEKALNTLSTMQNAKGGYSSWGTENSESCAQVIVALCELGIPMNDPRFIKNGNTLLDNLMTYYDTNTGAFKHVYNSEINQMATEQGFYAIVSAQRAAQKKNSLYRMQDAKVISTSAPMQNTASAGKEITITEKPVIAAGKTFYDITNSPYKSAIESLAQRGIINGKTENSFNPDGNVTRAEFATIITKSLDIAPTTTSVFSDVKSNAWYAGYVGSAYQYKIVSGVSADKFNPNGNISVQEVAVMLKNVANLAKQDTNISDAEAQNILSKYNDAGNTASWAKSALAYCYKNNILDSSKTMINGQKAVTRAEVSQMVYNLMVNIKMIK